MDADVEGGIVYDAWEPVGGPELREAGVSRSGAMVAGWEGDAEDAERERSSKVAAKAE